MEALPGRRPWLLLPAGLPARRFCRGSGFLPLCVLPLRCVLLRRSRPWPLLLFLLLCVLLRVWVKPLLLFCWPNVHAFLFLLFLRLFFSLLWSRRRRSKRLWNSSSPVHDGQAVNTRIRWWPWGAIAFEFQGRQQEQRLAVRISAVEALPGRRPWLLKSRRTSCPAL